MLPPVATHWRKTSLPALPTNNKQDDYHSLCTIAGKTAQYVLLGTTILVLRKIPATTGAGILDSDRQVHRLQETSGRRAHGSSRPSAGAGPEDSFYGPRYNR